MNSDLDLGGLIFRLDTDSDFGVNIFFEYTDKVSSHIRSSDDYPSVSIDDLNSLSG